MKKILTSLVLVGFLLVNVVPYTTHAAIYVSNADEYAFDVHDKPLLTEWQPHTLQRFTYINWFTAEKLQFNYVEPTFSFYHYFSSITEIIGNEKLYQYEGNTPFFAIINNAAYDKDAEYGFAIDSNWNYLYIINDIDGQGNTCLYLTNKNGFKEQIDGTCIMSHNLRTREPYIIFFNINYRVISKHNGSYLNADKFYETGINSVNVEYLVSRHTFLEGKRNGLSFLKSKLISYNHYDWNYNLKNLPLMGRYNNIASSENTEEDRKYKVFSPNSKSFIKNNTRGQIMFYGLKFSGFLYDQEDVREKHNNQYYQENFYKFHDGQYAQPLAIRGNVDFLDQFGPFVIEQIYGEPLHKPTLETAIDIKERENIVDTVSLRDCGLTEMSCHFENFSYIIRNSFSSITSTISKGLTNFFSPLLDGIKSIFSWIWNNIKGYLEPFIKPIYDFIMNLIEEGKIIFEKLKTFFNDVYEIIKNLFKGGTDPTIAHNTLTPGTGFRASATQKLLCDKDFILINRQNIEKDEGAIGLFLTTLKAGFGIFSIIDPIAPTNGTELCTYQGVKTLHLRQNSWVDIIFFLMFGSSLMLLFIKNS